MRSRLTEIHRVLLAIERLVAASLLFGILAAVFAQVVARYVFNSPLTWSGELSRYMNVWLTFVSAAMVMGYGGHITVEVINERISPVLARVLSVVAYFAITAACVTLVMPAIEHSRFVHRLSSSAMQIPMSTVYSALAVGFTLMTLQTLLSVVAPMDEQTDKDVPVEHT